MDLLARALGRIDVDPVSAALLAAMVVARLVVGRGPRPRGPRKAMVYWLDAGVVAVACALLLIRPFLVDVAAVETPAMAPTLRGGRTPQIDGANDRILVARYLVPLRWFRYGEILTIEPPDPQAPARVARVLGLPGDHLELAPDGRLLRNGRPVAEPYAVRGRLVLPPQAVPSGCYFVLGDNRDADPVRDWWFGEPVIAASRVRGKAVAVCWPPGRARLLR